MLRKAGGNRIGFQRLKIETLLLHIHAKRRMIGCGHDHIKSWLRASVIEHETKEVFIVDTPLIASRARVHLIAAIGFFKSLFAAELANSFPTQESAIEKSRTIA